MLRRLLDFQLSLVEKGKPLHKLHPLVSAADTFLYEAPINTSKGPHIRDAVDVKRWMMLVVVALIPCILMAIWNSGLQKFVYSSGDYTLMNDYLQGATSFQGYFDFAMKDNHYLSILYEGLGIFLPLVLISYIVGGIWEAIFAVFRGHEISEGFLVTGILYALILPPTIPYWMAAVGVSAGVVLGKEVFGGSGMNIVNPALACRTFLFFTFPAKMSGNVWVGSNPTVVRESLLKMNQDAHTTALDGYSQATPLARFNVTSEIKRVHVDAIASNTIGKEVNSFPELQAKMEQWNSLGQHDASLGQLSQEQLQSFVTTPSSQGGLGLSPGYYEDAYSFASLNYGVGHDNDWNFFFGDRLGSLGETSVFACLLGAIFLIYTGIGSWRTIVGMGIGAYLTALLFQLGSTHLGVASGAWNPAIYAFPAHKHLLLGGLAFGAVFMATDPVSSPSINSARWVYGLFCGIVTIVIREINPAYPEGVMLAILIANVFAPLFDYYAALNYRTRSFKRVRASAS
ncbi:MAG: Na(+)-transporting NADH-quinone reductase subunit B [Parachlamydiaceae bacterium]|nr:Na(+)-transporting NADH-quinone reductase subunit B [Parachlamydiaceae bacterium]